MARGQVYVCVCVIVQSFQVAQRVQQAAEKATERASGDIARLESRVAQLEEENRRLRLQAVRVFPGTRVLPKKDTHST